MKTATLGIISILLIVFFIVTFTESHAQVKPPTWVKAGIDEVSTNGQIKKAEPTLDTNAVCKNPDVLAEFPGGKGAY